MPVKNRTAPPRDLKNVEVQRGVTRFEMATVVMLVGLLAAPLIALAPSSLQATRTGMTEMALERARDALIEYAAANDGCLPFAADYEGGLPDTDASGAAAPGSADTGVGKLDAVAGDLPWAELGLAKAFLDGNQLRVQYYAASRYTDKKSGNCAARFLGFEWDPSVTYTGSTSDPVYVYYTPSGSDRRLYQIIGTLRAGAPPNRPPPSLAETTLAASAHNNDTSITVDSISGFSSGDNIYIELNNGTLHMTSVDGAPNASTINITDAIPGTAFSGNQVAKIDGSMPTDVSQALSDFMLEVRRGPDVTAAGTQSEVLSAQNVFVLIAPGKNRNTVASRAYIRDANHVGDSAGNPWPLDSTIPKTVVFSATHNIDPTDHGNDGDDTLLVMSFINYKAALSKYGLNMEPVGCQANSCPE